MSRRRAQRILLLLTMTRWIPTGLMIAAMTLLPLERGLTITQTLSLISFTGIVVFVLELPTGGTADSLGRRPVLLAAGAAQVVATGLFAAADSFWTFAASAVAMGVFRALDSGPLEAWFVDTVHAAEPGADVDDSLSAQGVVLGCTIAIAALASGGLVAWHPVTHWPALTLPAVLAAIFATAHVVALAVLVRESAAGAVDQPDTASGRLRMAWREARRAPRIVREGISLVAGRRVLLALVAVEIFWCTAMVVFEQLMPIRLSEVLGSEERAGATMGAIAAAGWAVFALGAGLAGLLSRRIGVARTALLARVSNGLGAVWMGLAAGPGALICAYLITYGLHGSAGPSYQALLHRQADAAHRTTILSIVSMTAFATTAIASPLLGWLAETASTQLAMIAGGMFSILGALCFVPARREERRLAQPADATRAP